LGPADIYLDMIFVPEPYWDMKEPYTDVHYTWNGPLNCTVYHANIGHYPYVRIQLHQLEMPTELDLSMIQEVVDDSTLLPASWTTSASNLTIAGHKGMMINATSPEGSVVRVVGFSPDGDGGQGRLICLLRSDLSWSFTKALLESMRILDSELASK
jgi:hypothetical protein